MKKNLTKVVGGILLGVVLLAALAACGGSARGSTGSTPAPTTPLATSTSQPTAIPTATATPTATVVPAPTPSPTGSLSSDPLVQGKLVFEKTAGGLGCAYCHGLDGRGKGPTDVNAANIRGLAEAQVRSALGGGVAMMSFIKLSDEEVTAVVAYLKWLATQP